MKVDILTIFPDFFTSPLQQSLIGKAVNANIVDIRVWNVRDFAEDKHRMVDDEPYGGGPGMVMKIEPIVSCLEYIEKVRGRGYKILMSPSGRLFDQEMASKLGNLAHLVIICGRYEGIDGRITHFIDDEISIGNYVLMGGEIPAMVVLEASLRFVKGVVGKEESVRNDSFSSNLLECPQFTRPADFKEHKVPQILMSGNHKLISLWRLKQSLKKTAQMRPDLFDKIKSKSEFKDLIKEMEKENA